MEIGNTSYRYIINRRGYIYNIDSTLNNFCLPITLYYQSISLQEYRLSIRHFFEIFHKSQQTLYIDINFFRYLLKIQLPQHILFLLYISIKIHNYSNYLYKILYNLKSKNKILLLILHLKIIKHLYRRAKGLYTLTNNIGVEKYVGENPKEVNRK